MDALTLSEQERRWYWELFRLLDVDSSDQLPGAQTFDMFLSSGLQPEVVNQVHCRNLWTSFLLFRIIIIIIIIKRVRL